MASTNYFKPRKTYRVCYTLQLGNQKKEKRKYQRLMRDARVLEARVQAVEIATRSQRAPLPEIEQWIELGYITPDEAAAAFPGCGRLGDLLPPMCPPPELGRGYDARC